MCTWNHSYQIRKFSVDSGDWVRPGKRKFKLGPTKRTESDVRHPPEQVIARDVMTRLANAAAMGQGQFSCVTFDRVANFHCVLRSGKSRQSRQNQASAGPAKANYFFSIISRSSTENAFATFSPRCFMARIRPSFASAAAKALSGEAAS